MVGLSFISLAIAALSFYDTGVSDGDAFIITVIGLFTLFFIGGLLGTIGLRRSVDESVRLKQRLWVALVLYDILVTIFVSLVICCYSDSTGLDDLIMGLVFGDIFVMASLGRLYVQRAVFGIYL